MQIPDDYFREVCSEMNLPEKGQYGVGMLFFTNDESEQKEIEANLNALIEQEGQIVLGWRTCSCRCRKNREQLEKKHVQSIRQVFIGASEDIQDDLAFERKLYHD